MLGKPKIKPIKNANLTSPIPIAWCPLILIKDRKKKNKAVTRAQNKWGSIKCFMLNIKYKKEIIIAGRIILSGIIPYFMSAKNTTIKEDAINK